MNNHFFHKFNSFKFKLFLTIFIIMVIFNAIIIGLWSTRTLENEEKNAISYISNVIRISSTNFRLAISDINAITIMISQKADIKLILQKESYSSSIEQLNDERVIGDYTLPLFSYKYNILNSILVSNLKGVEINSGINTSFKQLQKFPQLNELLESQDDVIILPPHLLGQPEYTGSNPPYKQMSLSLVRSIKNGDTAIGITVADIKCNILLDFFNINLKDNGRILVLDNKSGNAIFKPDFTYLNINMDEKTMIDKVFSEVKTGAESKYINLNGKSFLLVYNHSDFPDWITVGLIPKEKLLEGYMRTRDIALSLSVLFIIISAFVSYLFSNILSKNLLNLNKAMKHFDGDNLDVSLIIKSRDEVGQLNMQFNQMVQRIKSLFEDIKVKEMEKRKAEMKALQSQINPHFLYNTLNTIKFLSVLQGSESIKNVSESLSTLMHVNMDNRTLIPIHEEIQYLKSYLSIQEYKYNNKFIAEIVVEQAAEDLMILKLLVQPIVENALLHGIAPMTGQGLIRIKVFKEDNFLKVKIHDNGAGINPDTLSQILEEKSASDSIAIHNILSRINVNFGPSYGISIVSEPYLFTIVEFSLPIITEEEVEYYA